MISVRDARVGDAAGIAALAAQLGYAVDEEVIARRLAESAGRAHERVIVAVNGEGAVAGWCSLEIIRYIHVDPFAEITGFVVDRNRRKQGIGRLMVAEAARWTRERGLPSISLHTNVIRAEAHLFYEAVGFTRAKQQYVYTRDVHG